ncbi:MAG TPA: hypothetical protein VEZ40_05465 [Pyrinomonadaceae bacterium]|nr:hypothetical protein [Pyrinomonadaceae bacterium]
MTNNSRNDEADRVAGGTGVTEAGNGENDDIMPGEIGGARVYLPSDGRAATEGTPATAAANTTGAAGEMDFTGAPAGTSGAGDAGSGSGGGSPVGGGTGGGSMSTGGMGKDEG